VSQRLVPIIDIGASRPRAEVGAELDAACRDVGFFEVVGHGVPDAVIAAMQTATAAFFALPEVVKRAAKPADLEVNRGYSARASEGLGYSVGVQRPPDLFEAFNIGPDEPDLDDPAVIAERERLFAANVWPAEVPELRPALVAYMAEARRVADRLTDLFVVALDLPDGFFRPYFTHSTDTLRVIHYETQPGDPDPLEGQIGMGEHTDYGVCTVLYADQVPGLQVLSPAGDWVDVVPSPGALLVNLGDLTAEWTNDRWRSTLHRVLPPARLTDRVNRRRSVAFFHDGNHDALIECLPTCTGPDRPPRYAPVLAGEHLMAKLMGPRLLQQSAAQQTTGTRLS
jgi:isopenicillin N synthase-like dioxygenase